MFIHKIALVASENHSKHAAVYRQTRITMLMKVWQTEQVPPSAATLFAQFSQNRAWPHGTRANPSRGATRQISQHSGSVILSSLCGYNAAAQLNFVKSPAHSFIYMPTASTYSVIVHSCNVHSCNFSHPR